MSLQLDAEELLDQLTQAETATKRMQQNQAYGSSIGTIVGLYDVANQMSTTIEARIGQIDELTMIDPTRTIFNERWTVLRLEITRTRSSFRTRIEEPLGQLILEVEGSAAKNRWLSRESFKRRPIPPVLEVQGGRATIVGISDYSKTGLKSLSTPKADAETIHDLFLKDPRYGRQSARTSVLVDGSARRNEILGTLNNDAQAAGKEDMLLFYFSGHGDLIDGEAVLIPYDHEDRKAKDSAVLISDVSRLIAASPAGVKVIILDSCHSGPDIPLGEEEKRAEVKERGMDPDFVERVFEQARGTAVLSSCVARQVSWTYSAKGLSAFTYFLNKGLQGDADSDQKGFVTVSDVFHYVANEVRAWGEERERPLIQTPALNYTTTGEIILMDYR